VAVLGFYSNADSHKQTKRPGKIIIGTPLPKGLTYASLKRSSVAKGWGVPTTKKQSLTFPEVVACITRYKQEQCIEETPTTSGEI